MLLPVTGGYDGGKLKLEKQNEAHSLDFHQKCHQYFYCCAFFTGCKYEWEPIERGCMVVLDFDIVWRPSPTTVNSSISLPSFLAATKEIKEILSPWNYQPLKQTVDGEMFSENVEITAKCSVVGPSKKDLGNSSPSDDSEDDHLLLIPLNETYHQTNFHFSTLREKDRQIVHILQSIDFIDVHLATLVHSPGGMSLCPKISQWIHSDQSIPQFKNYHLKLRDDHAHNIMTSNCLIDDNSTEVCPVIIIQPRHQSIHRCCHFQFDAALSYLESRLTSAANWEKMRLHLLTCLGCVLQFCQEKPLKVWDVPEPKATERTLRLLKICHHLKAQVETRFLLDILGQDFEKPSTDRLNSQPKLFYEGVRNELVARSIVDVLWNTEQGNETCLSIYANIYIICLPYFTDWSVVSIPLLQLISSNRFGQIKSFSTIVTALLDYRCYPEAICVAETIFSVISSNDHLVTELGQQDIDSYVDAIISLEKIYPEAVDESWVLEKFIVPVFTLLAPQQKCQLFVHLQANDNSRLGGFHELCNTLTKSLIESDLCCPAITPEVVMKVIDCHLQLNDKKILSRFVYHILWGANNKGARTNNVWLRKLLAVAIDSPLAKSSLSEVLAMRIETLAKAPRSICRDEFFRLFLVLLRIERRPKLADSTRIASLTPIYQKMDTNQLKSLVVDLLKLGNSYMKRHRSIHDLLFKMGIELMRRDYTSFDGELPIAVLVDVLHCFAESQDLSLASLFITGICGIEKWTWRGKIQFISAVLTSTDIWPKLIEKKTMTGFVRNSQTALLRPWIAGLEVAADSESTAVEFQTHVAECFLFSIGQEKMFYSHRTDPNSTLFTSLFDKLPVQELARLIGIVYQANSNEVSCLKKSPTALNLYRQLCRQFIDKCDVTSWSELSDCLLVRTTKSLLWLGDESFLVFTDKILASHPIGKPNGVILKIANLVKIHELPFPRARESLCRLLELRVSALKGILEKENSASPWRIPDVSLPEHPVVEQFLHSTDQQMTYANFVNAEKAQQFAIFLTSSFGAENEFSVHVQTEGEGFKAKCEIVKVRNSKELLVSEKRTLEEALDELKAQPVYIDSHDIVILPCTKKQKLDFSLIDNSDSNDPQ